MERLIVELNLAPVIGNPGRPGVRVLSSLGKLSNSLKTDGKADVPIQRAVESAKGLLLDSARCAVIGLGSRGSAGERCRAC